MAGNASNGGSATSFRRMKHSLGTQPSELHSARDDSSPQPPVRAECRGPHVLPPASITETFSQLRGNPEALAAHQRKQPQPERRHENRFPCPRFASPLK